MSTSVQAPPAGNRTVDEIIQELAADVIVPHYDDVVDRHSALYADLCDAVTEGLGDHTTTGDFCEQCQPAYLRVDEERNAELVVKERMAWRLGLAVGQELSGRRTTGVTPAPVATTAADTAPDSPQGDHKDVGEVMTRLVSELWLAKSVVDCQIGKDVDVHEFGWWALAELLGSAAEDLNAAHDRYCTESNALHAAAEAGGAA